MGAETKMVTITHWTIAARLRGHLQVKGPSPYSVVLFCLLLYIIQQTMANNQDLDEYASGFPGDLGFVSLYSVDCTQG